MAIKRLQELSDRWLNDPELTGVLRAIICVMIKTALLKEHVVSLEHGSSSISTILDLLDDYSATVLGLFASGEIIFFSDMSTTVLSMPVMLCYHVSCSCPRPLMRQARHSMSQLDVSRVLETLRTLSGALEHLIPLTLEDHPLRYIERCYHRLLDAFEEHQKGQTQGSDEVVRLVGCSAADPSSHAFSCSLTSSGHQASRPRTSTRTAVFLSRIPSGCTPHTLCSHYVAVDGHCDLIPADQREVRNEHASAVGACLDVTSYHSRASLSSILGASVWYG